MQAFAAYHECVLSEVLCRDAVNAFREGHSQNSSHRTLEFNFTFAVLVNKALDVWVLVSKASNAAAKDGDCITPQHLRQMRFGQDTYTRAPDREATLGGCHATLNAFSIAP